MTQTVGSRPTPLSRVWAGNKIIAEDLVGDDLADVLQLHSDASIWWVIPRQQEDQLRSVADGLDLDHHAIADLLADDRRAMFEQLGHTRLVISHAVSLNKKTAELRSDPASMIITERAVVCLNDEGGDAFSSARYLDAASQSLSQGGVEAAVQAVISAVIGSYEDVVEWLEDSSDQLADALFEERPLTRSEQLWAFRLRAVLSQLRRLTDPMRSVISELGDSYPNNPALIDRQWSKLTEQHHRVANAADALREALSSVFDTSLALADLRMNAIMKKLTGWAAIIAVPTLVTGFVGMNVRFPLDGTSIGFYVYLVLMVVVVVILYLSFKRRDWI